jgi:hypothetical protein
MRMVLFQFGFIADLNQIFTIMYTSLGHFFMASIYLILSVFIYGFIIKPLHPLLINLKKLIENFHNSTLTDFT